MWEFIGVSAFVMCLAGLFAWLRRGEDRDQVAEAESIEYDKQLREEALRRRATPFLSQNPTNEIRPATLVKAAPDLEIEYADVDGVVTRRGITLMNVEAQSHAIYIRAICHLRGAERTFRADRMLSVRDKKSGQVVPEPEAFFYSYVPEDERPDPDHDAVMSCVRPGLDCLIWIAMADREIASDEAEVLIAYIAERNGMAGAKFAAVPWN